MNCTTTTTNNNTNVYDWNNYKNRPLHW
jgi:hypothetical protein